MLARMLILNALLIGGAIVCLILARYWYRRFRAKNRPLARHQHCPCGYSLLNLEIPRCPECGRMIGFNKTPKELGISEEDMRAFAEKRKSKPHPDSSK